MADERERVKIAGERVVLRPAGDGDILRLIGIMESPGVEDVWIDFTADEFKKELHDPELHPFMIDLADGSAEHAIGYIQYDEETDPMYRHARVDIALHADYQDQGFGTEALRALVRYLFEGRDHHRITMDPAVTNERAIRCYAKVGFRAVGVMRQYERGADGRWHDSLLMDLLAEELIL